VPFLVGTEKKNIEKNIHRRRTALKNHAVPGAVQQGIDTSSINTLVSF
jgi:hypothetical protein